MLFAVDDGFDSAEPRPCGTFLYITVSNGVVIACTMALIMAAIFATALAAAAVYASSPNLAQVLRRKVQDISAECNHGCAGGQLHAGAGWNRLVRAQPINLRYLDAGFPLAR
jgi:hypothetical protein